MASLTLSLRSALLPLTLTACSFEATGLGSDGSGVVDSTTDAGTMTGMTSPTTGGTTQDPGTASDPSTGGTTSTTIDPVTTTDPSTTDMTTDPGTTTAGPMCGDGAIDPGEECDAGAMNGDDQACTPGCKTNICGDGKQGPGEGCDDGNLADGDGCSAACASEDCGDNVVQPGEECDDGNMTDNDGCTNNCTNPVCGDKIVQAGEDCDDAGESATCNSDCTTSSCGDGNLNMTAGELCDDNNGISTDACVACKPAVCGDGFVQAGVEGCDDKNDVDNDACSNACQAKTLRAFVSTALYSGNLGGLAGADAKCKSLAQIAQLGGNWMAWLSDGANGPAQRFTTKGGAQAYVRIDGKTIANDWASLTSMNLLLAIDISELGLGLIDTTRVWTNTKPDGTPASADKHCGTWGNANGNTNGIFGRRNLLDAKWSIDTDENCNTQKHLYCFEQ